MFPSPGVEPGTWGWGFAGEVSKSYFNVSTDTAPVQNLQHYGSRTRDLWVEATNPNR